MKGRVANMAADEKHIKHLFVKFEGNKPCDILGVNG
jgi:hypothetical protein